MTTSRTFDIIVATKGGTEHTFSSINKEEHEGLEEYLKGKKLRVKNKMAEDLIVPALDDDDEEMQSVASSGDEVPRPRAADDDEDSEEGESLKVPEQYYRLLNYITSFLRFRW